MNRADQNSVGSGGKQRMAPSRLEIEPVMVDRPWLTSALTAALSDPSCRIVLLNGQMGSGKSAFLADWSAQNPDAMLYSIRKNSHERNRSGSANDLLSAVIEHFSSLYPALFESVGLSATIVQRIDQIAAGGSVVGVHIDELHALPFTSPAITVEQLITAAAGQMTALDIGQCVTDARLLGIETLQEIALFGPAVRAQCEPGHRHRRA